jgi:uncharacterized protein (DUF58 family)
MSELSDRIDTLRPKVAAIADRAAEAARIARPLTERLRQIWDTVSPLGRTVAVIGLVAWIAGWRLGWRELMVAAGACVVLLVVTALFVLGRAVVSIDIRLEPRRVVAGDTAAGQVTVVNDSGRRTLPFQIQLPVGREMAGFAVGSLATGQRVEELFVIPTERRGVIPVGPATSMRGDPLGLFHREAASSTAHELIVHPRTISVPPFGSGLLRDLEGLTTNDLSSSDLAFHGLREYAPGDETRHIHWRSTARAGGLGLYDPDEVRLMVRQFLDTRRSTLCVVVDGQPSGYLDPDQFELALEIAGSIALRACRDGLPGVVVAGDQAAGGVVPHVLLDALSRSELRKSIPSLPLLVSRAVAHGADVSVAVLLSGAARTVAEMQRAAARFPLSVQVLAVRVVPGETPGIEGRGRAVVARVGELTDLPHLLRMGVAA